MVKSKTVKSALSQLIPLWDDHFYWTRMFIQDFASNAASLDETLKRLAQNYRDLGTNLGIFYGEKNGMKYEDLLTKHILQAKEILETAVAGQDLTPKLQAWSANGKEIADFLSSLNSKIDKKEMEAHMQMHLDTTLDEAKAILAKDWVSSVAKGDIALKTVREMANRIQSAWKKKFKK